MLSLQTMANADPKGLTDCSLDYRPSISGRGPSYGPSSW